jgi:hypothetical protein
VASPLIRDRSPGTTGGPTSAFVILTASRPAIALATTRSRVATPARDAYAARGITGFAIAGAMPMAATEESDAGRADACFWSPARSAALAARPTGCARATTRERALVRDEHWRRRQCLGVPTEATRANQGCASMHSLVRRARQLVQLRHAGGRPRKRTEERFTRAEIVAMTGHPCPVAMTGHPCPVMVPRTRG